MDTVTYEIRVAGHLDDHWAAALGDLTLVRLRDGTTSLTGPLDQARLHGVLARIRDLGVPLVTVRPLEQDRGRRNDSGTFVSVTAGRPDRGWNEVDDERRVRTRG
jgi:hypothetical protein